MMNIPRPLYWLIFLFMIGTALFLRTWQLELRPLHGDEANQAMKTGILYETGRYTYDPHEHHGPTLYYLALPFLYLSGAEDVRDFSIVTLRLVPALFGAAILLLLAGFTGALGRHAVFWAALFTAISHAMVYYSRYYVQEMLLVFFTLGILLAGYHYLRTRRLHWAVLLGVAIGLTHATKETCILAFGGMTVALGGTWLWARLVDREPIALRPLLRPRHLLLIVGVAAAVSITLFSAFFTHARGPLDSLLTYAEYVQRAEGEGSTALHEHPWHYYLGLLGYTYRELGPRWTEAPVLLLALIGMIAVAFRRRPAAMAIPTPASTHFQRFLVLYALVLTIGFSVIPYKTPWNLLLFYQPLLMLAGVGAASLFRGLRPWQGGTPEEAPKESQGELHGRTSARSLPGQILSAALLILLLGCAAFLTRQSYYGNFQYPADTRNPYVYAHTSTAIFRLVNRLEDLQALHPAGHQMQINVVLPTGDYWPLPWYLRHFERVGYWHHLPENLDAPVLITAPRLRETLAPHLEREYFIENYGLRPNAFLHLYIHRPLWDTFIDTRR